MVPSSNPQDIEDGIVKVARASYRVAKVLPAVAIQRDHLPSIIASLTGSSLHPIAELLESLEEIPTL